MREGAHRRVLVVDHRIRMGELRRNRKMALGERKRKEPQEEGEGEACV